MTDDRIATFVDELLSPGGATVRLWWSLKEDPPPAEDLAPTLLSVIVRASIRGVIDGAALAVCLAADPRYRPVVETVLAEGWLPRENEHEVYGESSLLTGDALLWWFDLLDGRRDGTQAVHYLVLSMVNHPEELVEHRRDRIIALLSETTRGPANFTVDAVGSVLRVIGPCTPLERQWSGWLRDGLLDAQELVGPNGSTVASLHAQWVERCVNEGPFTHDWALLDETLAHWRELLADPERHRTGMYDLAQVMLDRRVLCDRLPDGVLASLNPGTPDAVAIEDGFRAAANGDEQRAGEIAMSLLRALSESSHEA